MCVLAMLFPVVSYPLLLFLVIPVLYFVFACVCNIALGVPIQFFLAALRQGTAMCYNVSTALRETMSSIIGCVVFILRQVTAMCYEITALCALIIKSGLSALCARMYFFISALRDLALSWLSIALCTTITAALQAWRLAGIVPLFWASEFVRYAISLDYMEYKAAVAIVFVDLRAVVALGVAIGIAPRICLYLLACIVDTHIAISLMITSITVRASTFILKAMKKFRLRMIYQVLAVLCLVILAINVIVAAIFVGVGSAIAIEGYMPSYPWLWVILTSMQACCYLLQCTGAIDGILWFLGYMPTIFENVVLGSIDSLAIVYPWVINKKLHAPMAASITLRRAEL